MARNCDDRGNLGAVPGLLSRGPQPHRLHQEHGRITQLQIKHRLDNARENEIPARVGIPKPEPHNLHSL